MLVLRESTRRRSPGPEMGSEDRKSERSYSPSRHPGNKSPILPLAVITHRQNESFRSIWRHINPVDMTPTAYRREAASPRNNSSVGRWKYCFISVDGIR